MHKRKALTYEELQNIKSQDDRPLEAIKAMLQILKEKSNLDLMCFLDSLLSTGHKETHDFFYYHRT